MRRARAASPIARSTSADRGRPAPRRITSAAELTAGYLRFERLDAAGSVRRDPVASADEDLAGAVAVGERRATRHRFGGDADPGDLTRTGGRLLAMSSRQEPDHEDH